MNQENKKKILFYYSCFLQVNSIGEAGKNKKNFLFYRNFHRNNTSTGTQHRIKGENLTHWISSIYFIRKRGHFLL